MVQKETTKKIEGVTKQVEEAMKKWKGPCRNSSISQVRRQKMELTDLGSEYDKEEVLFDGISRWDGFGDDLWSTGSSSQ